MVLASTHAGVVESGAPASGDQVALLAAELSPDQLLSELPELSPFQLFELSPDQLFAASPLPLSTTAAPFSLVFEPASLLPFE